MSNTAPPPDSGVAKASTAESCSSKDVHLPRQAATDLPESDSGTPAAAAQAPEVSDGSGLNRGLRNRHIQLIALGGAIGTGLFYGAADSIGAAGPAILVCYLIGGAVIYLIMRALGEMSVHRPTSGAFSEYAHDYWGELPGFVSGWNYWFNYIAVSMAELSVVGIYVNYWFPSVPSWLSAAVLLVVVTVINLLHVRAYGEFEFWFAIVKVVAIIAMVLLGAWVIVIGAPSAAPTGVANLWNDGGFFPTGISGVALGFVVVMFSFGGVELIGITAGEATDPRRSIPKAINQVVYRILLFYMGSVAIMVVVLPWDDPALAKSSFVAVLNHAGIPVAAEIMGVVIVLALLSSLNANLYGAARMLGSLADRGLAPRALTASRTRSVPVTAILASVSVGLVSVVCTYIWGDKVLDVLLTLVGATIIVTYTSTIASQFILRRRADAAGEHLPLRLWGYPWVPIVSALVVLAIVVLGMTADGLRQQLLSTFALTLVIYLIGRVHVRRKSAVSSETSVTAD
ncbi:MAG: amino acid permease [Propionibacterium sp.]|nr:amino acid permease [Propionibacterium sp.]